MTYLSHVQWCGVAVVEADPVEVLCGGLCVARHVGPEVGAVLGAGAVAQLHAVAPAHQLPAQVHTGACTHRGPCWTWVRAMLDPGWAAMMDLGSMAILEIVRWPCWI